MVGPSYCLSDCITYVHEPVQHHILEHAGLDEVTRPRRCLRAVSEMAIWSFVVHFLYILTRVVESKAYACMAIGASCACCYYSGCMTGNNLVDTAFYKALAVLIGFLLSFRATRANQRRTEAYILVEHLCDTGREMLYLLPPLSPLRQELKQILRYVFFNITRYFSYQYIPKGTKKRGTVAFNLAAVREENLKMLLMCSSLPELHISPKQLISCLAPILTDMVKASKLAARAAAGDSKERVFDYEMLADRQLCRARVDKLMLTYESISLMENTKTTSLYRAMLDVTLLLFLAIFPWVMTLDSVIHMAVSSSFVAFVYYGVDTVAGEVDDPFGNDVTDIPLDDMVREVFSLVDYEDAITSTIIEWKVCDQIIRGTRENSTSSGSRDAWRSAMKEIVATHHGEVATVLMRQSVSPEPALWDSDEEQSCLRSCGEYMWSFCRKRRYGTYAELDQGSLQRYQSVESLRRSSTVLRGAET